MRWIAWLLMPLAVAAQGKPEDSCSISGVVSNAATGEPVRRALVYLRRVDASPGLTNVQTAAHSATTDGAGHYAIGEISPGTYRLSAERSGFITGQYGARGPGKAGEALKLEAGQKSTGLAIRMTPHGVIAGRVLDEDGEAVTGADVQVLRLQYMQGRKQMVRAGGGSTNDLGEYRAFGLAPGRYYLSATYRQNPMLPQTDDEYVTTYFPRSTDPGAATALDLGPGAQLRNIDVQLARMHTVKVTGRLISEVRPPTGENPGRTNLNVMLSGRNPLVMGGVGTKGATVDPQGTFEFRNVAPGSYYLIGASMGAGKTLTVKTTIQVGGSNVEGVTLTIRGGVPVSGRVRVDGESSEGLGKVRVTLQPAEVGNVMFAPIPTTVWKDDGTFQVEDVSADKYSVGISGFSDGFYVKSVRSGNVDVLANGLEIAGVSPAPLEIVVSPRAGQVSGTVVDAKTQKGAPQMTVALVPQEKERRERQEFYKSTSTDSTGAFTFKGLTPGEYRVYAWEDVEFGAWMDAAFLKPVESRGEAVSVTEDGRHTVQVTLISTDAQ